MEINESAISPHGARYNSSSIAVVEFILDTLPKLGTPAWVLYTNLQASFTTKPQDVWHVRCPFNITDNTSTTHQRAIAKILKVLNQ